MKNDIPRYNLSGARDPTAHAALSSVQKEQTEDEARLRRLVAALRTMVDMADYDLLNRIELRDRRTGKIWR